MPDRPFTSISEDEERRSRIGSRAIVILVSLAALATLAGYLIFGRNIPVPGISASVPVGDYTNMTDTQAQQAIVNAGLQARIIKSASDTVEVNHVIRQNPSAGTKVDKNSLVQLFVSNGLPLVGLRDVRGYNVADAQRTLQDDKFKVRLDRRFNDAPRDSIVDQQPKPGARVRQGSTISLIVSNGQQPLQAPNFVGMNVNDAIMLARRSGISLDTSTHSYDPTYPSNDIASQDIPPGQSIDRATTIHVMVSTGPASNPAETVAVPNVLNARYTDAISQINGAGLTAAVKFAIQAESNGAIVDQEPAPGTQVASRSTVFVTLSVSGEVPDTEGDSLEEAQATLLSYGYRVDKITYTSQGADGKVVGTIPEVGTSLQPGQSVTLIVNGVQH